MLALFALTACRQHAATTLFTQLPSAQSGIGFRNDITENDSTHSFINEFGYMGGGVGIGDFNNDGLKDIFFTGNQVSCRLYINKGNNQFEDITRQAGLTTHDWATGVSIADVNHDGYDDIYVCVFGHSLSERSRNLLFINQHNLTFREQAAEYGLADTGYSTQAVFFDYDRDGDLDMYLSNYLLNGRNANNLVPRDTSGRSPANDRLYRNEGYSAALGHDVYTDVSMEAGIKEDGYGLGVVAGDFNGDGWPDMYVANDFVSNDELWLNNHKGGFVNCIRQAMGHQSYSSMGADAADLNNDGLPDIVTLDMAPASNDRKKQTFFFMNYERYQSERALGYEPEFARNMLQLNMGIHDSIPRFSEIGQLSGIAETDWSWSVLLADFDNDGWKDMHVTNGIGRDFINGDFLEFSSSVLAGAADPMSQRRAIQSKLASLEPVRLQNYLLLNDHELRFKDVSGSAGIGPASLSNGAAYADLDNDGDLDLVTNNINEPAFVLINNTRQLNNGISHYLRVILKGDTLNRHGIGSRLAVYAGGMMQVQEAEPVRGYFSSVDQDLLFGLGTHNNIDSVIITWPDGHAQVIGQIRADTTLTLDWRQSSIPGSQPDVAAPMLFTAAKADEVVLFTQHENIFNDFGLQRLLPQKYSQLGPFICTADIDGNGTIDFFIGNGSGYPGIIAQQQKNGRFAMRQLPDSAKTAEDMDCIFFDADGDGDQDLLITGGDVQSVDHSPDYHPRLYLNDGKGNLQAQWDAIPAEVNTIAGCVRAADFDADGDLDLFIGGRVSKTYPRAPASFLLQNNGGKFVDVTASKCAPLQHAGMITSAVWTDFDNDKLPDLIIAGEWMPIRFFKNSARGFIEVTGSTGLASMDGMWRSLVAADLDNDGDVDLVAGNLGLNCVYHVGPDAPMELLAADIDKNGTIDPVLFYHIPDKNGTRQLRPAISRSQLAEQVPSMKKKFLRYRDYADATAEDIFNGIAPADLLRLTCHETSSCWLENLGNGKFLKHSLPMAAQMAPVNAIIAADLDGDAVTDLLLAGNEYQTDVVTGRYDASHGVFLKGAPGKSFTAWTPMQTGLWLNGDIKSLAILPSVRGGRWLFAAGNNDALQQFHINQ